jgi:NADPH-dependent curcumin reductase CurA
VQIVTQLALLLNPKGRVITTAGSTAKCKQLKEMGCHAAINYKDKDWRKQLGGAMKDEKDGKKGNGWADVYFDNGGFLVRFLSVRHFRQLKSMFFDLQSAERCSTLCLGV